MKSKGFLKVLLIIEPETLDNPWEKRKTSICLEPSRTNKYLKKDISGLLTIFDIFIVPFVIR